YMLVWSAKTAKRFNPYHYSPKVLTTAQKDQFCRYFKKYIIESFKYNQKRVSYKYDGTYRFLRRNVFSVCIPDFFHSSEFREMPLGKKLPDAYYFNFEEDRIAIFKKTIILLKKAGYKAEINGNYISVWKV
ncbi:TPA: hypothetical protein ACGO3Y_002183, partial [Streptococcus suis]